MCPLDGVCSHLPGADADDPVALLDQGTNAEGSASYAAAHDGVAYYFASEANLKAFEANPARYVPQYGGFCAFGVSVGKKFDGDPRYADIVDGKLYLFVNAAVFEKYLADKENTLRKAAERWPTIKHSKVEDL